MSLGAADAGIEADGCSPSIADEEGVLVRAGGSLSLFIQPRQSKAASPAGEPVYVRLRIDLDFLKTLANLEDLRLKEDLVDVTKRVCGWVSCALDDPEPSYLWSASVADDGVIFHGAPQHSGLRSVDTEPLLTSHLMRTMMCPADALQDLSRSLSIHTNFWRFSIATYGECIFLSTGDVQRFLAKVKASCPDVVARETEMRMASTIEAAAPAGGSESLLPAAPARRRAPSV